MSGRPRPVGCGWQELGKGGKGSHRPLSPYLARGTGKERAGPLMQMTGLGTTMLAIAASGTGATGASGAAGAIDMLRDLAIIMCVAAVTTVLFQRIRQPVVLGYLLAGVIVGPHLPVPLFANEGLAHQMSELGVVLLMFSLGLEFNLRSLVQVGPRAGLVAIIECSLMIWLGYLTARLFGWQGYERIFTGVIIAISSTTIIVKAFAEQAVKGKITQVVFGILIIEDLIAILMLAILTPVAKGAGLSTHGSGHDGGAAGRVPDRLARRSASWWSRGWCG